MSRECAKCGNHIPLKIKIGSKIKNLQKRKYCLDCSPFGKHNTRQLHLYREGEYITGKNGRKHRIVQCEKCNKMVVEICHVCYQRKRAEKMENKVHDIVGRACWICGYDKGTQMLDFHHMNPPEKDFCVNRRSMTNMAWKNVWNEMKKCVLLCCRCHREVEYGYIASEKTEQLYKERWAEIVGSYSG